MKVIGKHREILIYYVGNTYKYYGNLSHLIGDIKKRNSNGKWYISYYIDQQDERIQDNKL